MLMLLKLYLSALFWYHKWYLRLGALVVWNKYTIVNYLTRIWKYEARFPQWLPCGIGLFKRLWSSDILSCTGTNIFVYIYIYLWRFCCNANTDRSEPNWHCGWLWGCQVVVALWYVLSLIEQWYEVSILIYCGPFHFNNITLLVGLRVMEISQS
jgi:hypothetical protein